MVLLKIKKVCVCTGTRAEYGLLKQVMREIMDSKKLELQLVVSGMHLLPRFGNTIKTIKKDGFEISARPKIFVGRDSEEATAQAIGNGIKEFSKVFKRLKPDIVIVLGDRTETFATAVAASTMNIPIAHIHGGDFAQGGLDEVFRFCISKLAHIHFAATKKSATRLKKMGEEKWRIHIVGAPGLDSIISKKFWEKERLCKKLAISPSKPIIIVLQHSISTQPENAGKQMAETMRAIKQIGIQTIVIYPNNDAGGRKIIKEIERNAKLPFIKTFKNLDREIFLGLMACSNVMVGNSSSGIIEAPIFRLPVVNIGPRQKGRERSDKVIDVGYNSLEIKRAIKKALCGKAFASHPQKSKSLYGKGNASKRIVKALERLKTNTRLLQKKMS